jgi:flagellar biogenesis protein FliO
MIRSRLMSVTMKKTKKTLALLAEVALTMVVVWLFRKIRNQWSDGREVDDVIDV